MSGLLDTSVLMRYLTGDPPAMAERAAAIIDGREELLITDVVLVETAHTLGSYYRVPRAEIVDQIIELVRKVNIALLGLDKALVISALLLARPSVRVSFGDAMIWAAARSSGIKTVYSFDRRFPSDGVELRRGLS